MRGSRVPGSGGKLLVLLLGLLLYLPTLGHRDLWSPSTAGDAEAARQMTAHGDVLVPRLNFQPLLDRPPLHIWLIALATRFTGRANEFAVCLPSALAAIASLLLVFSLARDWFDPPAAWVAVAALATSPRYLWLAQSGEPGMLLLFLVVSAVWLWSRSYDQSRPTFSLAFFVVCGLAGLAGGLTALLMPLFAVVIFLASTRDGEKLRELHPEWGIGICALVIASWVVPATAEAGRSAYGALVNGLTPTALANPLLSASLSWGHLRDLVLGSLPWSLLLPGAVVAAWRGLKGETRKRVQFLYCWAMTSILLVILMPRGGPLLFTVYPALAMIVGAGASGLRTSSISRHWFSLPFIFAAVAASVGTFFVPFGGRRLPESSPWRTIATSPITIVLLLVIAVGMWIAWRWSRFERLGRAVAVAAASVGLASLAAAPSVLPGLNASESVKPLCTVFLQRSSPIQPVATYPTLDARVLFYTGRTAVPLRDLKQLYRYAHAPGRKWLFIDETTFDSLSEPLPLHEVDRAGRGARALILLTDPANGPTSSGHDAE